MSAWIVVVVAGAVAAVDTAAFLQGMFNQPLVICALLGAALGLPLEGGEYLFFGGAYLGALLQMLWLSELPVGAASSSDSGPAAAGAAGGALIAMQSGLTDTGMAGLAVLLAAIPLAWAGGYLIRWQREIQSGFLPRVITAVERNRAGLVRWYLLVGIGHAAIRGALMAAAAAVVTQLLLVVLGLLLPPGSIPPYTLLAAMLGVGVGITLKLFSEPRFRRWLIGGLAVGTLIVMVF